MHRSLRDGIGRWGTRGGWAKLIAAAPPIELNQACLRLGIATVILLYSLWALSYVEGPIGASHAFRFIAGFILFAATIVLWILAFPRTSPLRRILGIAADNVAISYVMLGMGEASALILGVYLFVVFGNGFRYGRLYLYLSQGFALVGFIVVMVASDFWSRHPMVGTGVLLTLIVIPFYVGELASKVEAARLKTEQALQECIEREQRRA